jgi:hypothetical protein
MALARTENVNRAPRRGGASAALLALMLAACTGRLDGSAPLDAGPDWRGDGPDASGDAGSLGVEDGGRTADAGRPPGRDAGEPPRDAGPAPDPDAGEPPGFDAGPCGPGGLSDALTVHSVAGVSPGAQLFGAPLEGGGALAAWNAGGTVRIQRLAGDGAAFGDPIDVAGNGLWGLAATPEGPAVLVSRGSDALYLVGTSDAGGVRFENRLLGEVDHDVTGNEWFGTGIRYGRLAWTGTELAAYYTVNRLWPDGIAHYGDQLRMYGPDGAEGRMRWSWGCSHSMEVRVVHNGTRLGPVCASDCYPSKGIHFDHRGGELVSDERLSNCAGGYGTSLGGVVPMDDGFWVTFTATDGRSSHDVGLVHVGNDRSIGAVHWLTADDARDRNVKAARYGSGFVVAWTGGDGQARFERFDATGASVEGPVGIGDADLGSASDFFVLADGDVGWVASSGGELQLARLRVCE